MRRFTLLVVAVLLMVTGATAASAQQWRKCSATHLGGAIVGDATAASIGPGEFLCFDLALNATTDSARLATFRCENFDVFFEPDMAATGSDVATVTINWCSAPTGTTANDCEKAITNTTLDGVVATATDAIYGAAAPWILVNPTADPVNDTARVIVMCNGPEE